MTTRMDMAGVASATALTFFLSSAFNWQEHLTIASARLERWQIDEMPISLIVLAFGMAWYSWRRHREMEVLLRRNRELAQRLIATQENERQSIARELHDEVAQLCTAIRVEALYLERCTVLSDITESVHRAAITAAELHERVRGMLRRLRPAELDELGLVAAIGSMCHSWAERSGLLCDLRHEGRLDDLGEAVDTAVYRVTQEAIVNVVQHAQAHTLEVELKRSPAAISLSIKDDGRGFEPKAATGFGLVGARERAAALGGDFMLDTSPGQGTHLKMVLPLMGEFAR